MKRQQFWLWLLLLPPLLHSCEKKYPDAPTIVTGKIVDENDKPMEGVDFSIEGVRLKGINPIPTFDVKTKSDKNGVYFLSQVIPKPTMTVTVSPYLYVGNVNHTKNNVGSASTTGIVGVSQSEWGKTILVDFKLIKK